MPGLRGSGSTPLLRSQHGLQAQHALLRRGARRGVHSAAFGHQVSRLLRALLRHLWLPQVAPQGPLACRGGRWGEAVASWRDSSGPSSCFSDVISKARSPVMSSHSSTPAQVGRRPGGGELAHGQQRNEHAMHNGRARPHASPMCVDTIQNEPKE